MVGRDRGRFRVFVRLPLELLGQPTAADELARAFRGHAAVGFVPKAGKVKKQLSDGVIWGTTSTAFGASCAAPGTSCARWSC